MKCSIHVVVTITALVAAAGAVAAKNRPTQFWNLTRNTISEFYLAPTGTSNWGPNQCKNDRDGTVDADERLHITDVQPGIYDGANLHCSQYQSRGRRDLLDRGAGPEIV